MFRILILVGLLLFWLIYLVLHTTKYSLEHVRLVVVGTLS